MLRDGTEVKTIPGFPDYAISRDGRVWSKPRKYSTHNGKWLIPQCKVDGHLGLRLSERGQGYSRPIHRLMLETFIGPRPDGLECRHLNGNKQDNRLSNLCWGTRSENEKDKVRHGTANLGERHGQSKLSEQNVRMIIYMYRTGLFLQREIAEIYNISISIISRIVNKQIWKHLWIEYLAI